MSLASTKLQVASSNRAASGQVTSAKQSLNAANRNYDTATTSADDATLVADEVAIADAEDALEAAEDARAASTIVAPMDGRITAVNATVGEASTGTAIELQSLQMAVTVSVGEADILDLAVGQQATVAISATGATATGSVTAIDPVAASSGSAAPLLRDRRGVDLCGGALGAGGGWDARARPGRPSDPRAGNRPGEAGSGGRLSASRAAARSRSAASEKRRMDR